MFGMKRSRPFIYQLYSQPFAKPCRLESSPGISEIDLTTAHLRIRSRRVRQEVLSQLCLTPYSFCTRSEMRSLHLRCFDAPWMRGMTRFRVVARCSSRWHSTDWTSDFPGVKSGQLLRCHS